MNPSYGIILWIVVGALAGWLGSKVMGTDARQGALANIVVGVIGAVVGGFVARTLFGDSPSNNGFLASTLVALVGSVIVIGVWKAISGSTRRSL
ncbi:MAG TPA: GlsB/YeaQ/YmgE family stress response membrane protein [Polyangia bacterium]